MEGAYRFIRNEHIKAEDIAEAGFHVTAQEALEHQTLLAPEDTTSLSYSHRSIRDDLGHSNHGNRHRAMLVNSTLLFAPQTQSVVGLIEQQRWTRDIAKRGQRRQYAIRPYKEKESYKWELASRHLAERLAIKCQMLFRCVIEKQTYLNTSLISANTNNDFLFAQCKAVV